MGRKKNSTSELDVAQKQADPLASRLSSLITDTKALAEHLACSPQAINQYRAGTSRPSLDNLCKIATFYGTTTDWLLGLPWGTKSLDTDVMKAVSYTGLSEKTVQTLHSSLDDSKERLLTVPVISELIASLDLRLITEKLSSLLLISSEFIESKGQTDYLCKPQCYEGGGVMLSPHDAKNYMIDQISRDIDKASRKAIELVITHRVIELYSIEKGKGDYNAVNQEKGD